MTALVLIQESQNFLWTCSWAFAGDSDWPGAGYGHRAAHSNLEQGPGAQGVGLYGFASAVARSVLRSASARRLALEDGSATEVAAA